ncbi:MAG: glycosyltransferase [Alphaproteobacteria bacterium]|nr:glycosyltransferase [Alphaproteobacteria bacterium]
MPTALDRLGVRDLGIRSYDAAAAYAEDHAAAYEIAVLAWTQVAHRLMPIIRARAPRCFVIFDTHDVNHVREFRYARVTGNARALRRALLLKEWETVCAAGADCTIAITPVDAAALQNVAPQARIRVATIAAPPASDVHPRDGANLLFVGNYGSPPNHDAALLLINEVLPRVRAVVPDATLTIAGSDPPADLRALDGGAVRVTGFVPDLAPIFASARVFMGALRFGSGIKGKVLESMAAGLPIVATPVAAEGIDLVDGRDALIAESPDALASGALRIIGDRTFGTMLARSAAAVVRRDHSTAVLDAQFAAILALRLPAR